MNARSSRQHGSIIIIAMVILFAITALVLTLNRQARTQAQASANDLASAQADAIERGAEKYALSLLTDYRTTLNTLTDTDFAAVPVGTGYFWIVRPTYGDTTVSSYGLVNEASKLNLNTVTADELSTIPGMTDEIAGAILDWRDTDDDLSQNGAESSTYNALPEPYNAKNADFESVDEMLLLNGMTRELMYGDPTQAQTGDNDPNNYYLAHGLSNYFTVWSTASLTAADGTTRIDMTDTSNATRTSLKTLLENQLGATRGDAVYNLGFPTARRGRSKPPGATDIFELAVRGNLTDDEFQKIEDYITSQPPGSVTNPSSNSGSSNTGSSSNTASSSDSSATTTTPTGPRGLIDVNTAPETVLMALTAVPAPSTASALTQSDIDSLIAARPLLNASSSTASPTSLSWVYDTLGAKAQGLGNYITGQGGQYSADIVSVSGNGRGYRHVKVVIDTTTTPPRIIYRHDITDRGWTFDPQVLASLKSGQGIAPGAPLMAAGGTY